MELIITEKDIAARRIADILSGEHASVEREHGVNVYRWADKRVVGLSGHVVDVDFPPEYSDWRDVEPSELIDAQVVKNATKENIVRTLRLYARKADNVTIATDYDREGELIGKEAYELVREVNEDVPVQRVRFSSITHNEVTKAFEDPDELDFNLAASGEARQVIDLVWGPHSRVSSRSRRDNWATISSAWAASRVRRSNSSSTASARSRRSTPKTTGNCSLT
ncbi:toprim domain-containing protein [Haladaptatus sp. GCM10025707]|uniref:toprim domain-containing protein n=1 Tax=Haladaptatus sp. GCM10025707 TaxID=3252658 RepID=UPI00362188B0